jgi:HTH-type transcriptional regulator / antitoxin HigA
MNKKTNNMFRPDYAVLPGETLLETIAAMGMSQAELAERTGRPKKTVNEIIMGKAAITPETAIQLERVLGAPASFWNNLEQNYQETKARIEEQKRLEKQTSWLDKIPVAELIKRGFVNKGENRVEQLKAILNFFGVASTDAWDDQLSKAEVAYRRSNIKKDNEGIVATWLRLGELAAYKIACRNYNEKSFKDALKQIRTLTVENPEKFVPTTKKLCSDAGVALLFVKEFPKLGVSGATWWMNSKKAVIQLSLRYKSDDHLWFSFFHEAGHILLHGKKAMFLDDGIKSSEVTEIEANKFAADFLIEPKHYRLFVKKEDFSKTAIKQYAASIGIAPGIVVGRLQHDGHLPFGHCNELKRSLIWK